MCSFYTRELIGSKPLEEVSIIADFGHSLLEKTAVKLLPVFQAVLKKIAIEDEFTDKVGGVPNTGPLNKDHPDLKNAKNKS